MAVGMGLEGFDGFEGLVVAERGDVTLDATLSAIAAVCGGIDTGFTIGRWSGWRGAAAGWFCPGPRGAATGGSGCCGLGPNRFIAKCCCEACICCVVGESVAVVPVGAA